MAASRTPEVPGATRIPVSLIRRDPLGWPREHLEQERVAEFEELYRESGPHALPPIEVVADGSGGYLVADGNHRFEAISAVDADTTEVVVLAVPPIDDPIDICFERGLVTAARSALRLTRAEKQAAILHLRRSRPALSNRDISTLVGCSHQTVGRVLGRSNGPDDHLSEASDEGAPARETAHRAAVKLFLGLERVYEARGLGIWDALTHDHTAERLARALEDAYGEEALDFATRFATWCDEAVSLLRERRS